jgi:hypothetical protein
MLHSQSVVPKNLLHGWPMSPTWLTVYGNEMMSLIISMTWNLSEKLTCSVGGKSI